MSFVAVFNSLPMDALLARAEAAPRAAIEGVINKPALTLSDFATLLSPAADELLEAMGRRSRAITQQRFGKTMRLFAPIYLSNECINNCKYCGFSRDNPILRVTLTIEEVVREAQALSDQGFRNLLLVAGEHPKFVSTTYLADCVKALRKSVPGIALEVGPMETEHYRVIADAGAEGLVVYQETYDRAVYGAMHTAGPKRDFDWRLATAERAYAAGFRRLGIGALFGLSDWRSDAVCLAAHTAYLLKACWKSQITVSFPRLRPNAGDFDPLTEMSDRELARLICAFRIAFPDTGLVLSTREPSKLRDGLIPMGITLMSAGSHTEPGGYTGAGRGAIHRTERGRIVEAPGAAESIGMGLLTNATPQFDIADRRSPLEVADHIRRLGYEPVWKDWDAVLSG